MKVDVGLDFGSDAAVYEDVPDLAEHSSDVSRLYILSSAISMIVTNAYFFLGHPHGGRHIAFRVSQIYHPHHKVK